MSQIAEPYSRLAAHIITRNYRELGCDSWDSRKVKLLCAKYGASPSVMAARMRIPATEFARRLAVDRWTPQDGLILTMLEREIDILRGDLVPERPLFPVADPAIGETNQ